MKTKKFLFYMLAALLGGCVPVMSLHSLYTEKDVVFDEKLLGTWIQDNNETTWEFTRHGEEPNNVYKLIFTDEEGKKGSFVAAMVKLKDTLFLDVYPDESPWNLERDSNQVEWPYNAFFLVPAHTFIKVDTIEPQLKMRLTAETKMKELLKENPNAVKHMSIEDRTVLTGSTKELQEFVLKYANDERLFTTDIVLTRKVDKTAAP